MTLPRIGPWGLLVPPILIGAAVMFTLGAPAERWLLHLVSALFGLLLYACVVNVPQPWLLRFSPVLLGSAALLVAVTFTDEGIQGVFRWHRVGPLQLHPSALFSPSALVFAAVLRPARPWTAYSALLVIQLLHICQPDAGQATALGLGAIALVLTCRRHDWRWTLPFALTIVAAWLRADPLPPAPFVEDIVTRARSLGVFTGFVTFFSLLCGMLAPFALPSGRRLPTAQLALAVYLGGTVVAPAFGEFPIPWLGFGPSPIIGTLLGLALLHVLAAPVLLHVSTERRSSVCSSGPALSCTRDTYVRSCSTQGLPDFCDKGVVLQGPDCGEFGLTCAEGYCTGTGEACHGEPPDPQGGVYFDGVACDGPELVACVAGRTARRRCEELGPGFTCQTVDGEPFCGLASECLPALDHARYGNFDERCEGDSVVFCNAGRVERVDCRDLGFRTCDVEQGFGCVE